MTEVVVVKNPGTLPSWFSGATDCAHTPLSLVVVVREARLLEPLHAIEEVLNLLVEVPILELRIDEA